jgi:hypothetical protein
MKKYKKPFDSYEAEIRKQKKPIKSSTLTRRLLTRELEAAKRESTVKKRHDAQLRQAYEDVKASLASIWMHTKM